MSRNKIVALSTAGLLLLGLIVSITSWYSEGVSLHNATIAQYSENQNKYDAFWKSVRETAQIPAKYKEDFKDLVVSETSAKYGKDGSSAMLQFFKERDLKLPSDMYTNLQRTIVAGRNDFKRGQKMLLDKQRKAANHRDAAFGVFAGIFCEPFKTVAGKNAPPEDLDGDGRLTIFDYNIVTSKTTQEAFKTGEAEPLKVF